MLNRTEKNSRAELGITTAQLLGIDVQESKVDRLHALRISRDRTAIRGGEGYRESCLIGFVTKKKKLIFEFNN